MFLLGAYMVKTDVCVTEGGKFVTSLPRLKGKLLYAELR